MWKTLRLERSELEPALFPALRTHPCDKHQGLGESSRYLNSVFRAGKGQKKLRSQIPGRISLKMAPAIPKTSTTKFRMPTSENLVPISIVLEIDGQHFKDAFTWNTKDPDSEVVVFARRTARDLKLPSAFIIPIAQSIQSQLTEFRSYEGLDMTKGERIVPLRLDLRVNRTVIRDQFLWDVNNFDNNPEEFARTLCKDMGIEDPEVGPAVAVAIRQQLYEIAVQSVSSREMRVTKKGRRDRGVELIPSSKLPGTFDLVKMFGHKPTFLRKRKEWDLYEPFIDILSAEEAEALDAREERIARLKKRVDDKL